MDQIKSQVDNLSELSDESIAELQTAIISEFESVESQDPSAETVDAMTSLADMLDTVRGETKRREAAAEELAARASEAAMRVKGEDVPVEEELVPAEDAPAEEAPVMEAADAETPAETEAPAESPEAEAPVEGDKAETPEEEKAETPEEEKAEPKKEEEKEKEFSSETATASIDTAEGIELSAETTETEISSELSVTESVELSAEEAGEIAAPEATEGDEPSAEVPAEEAPIVADASVEESEVVAEEPTESETLVAPVVEQEEQAPVTAAAEQPFEAPADRQPVVQVTEAPVAITAGADIPGYTAGSTINDMYEVASAMEKRIHSLRRVNGGDGEQHIVASITTQYDDARTLTTDAESNMAKIAAVAGPEALIASGGHAAPFEVKYDIYAIGSTTVRPVRDALPRFQADRGGIRFVTPPSFASGDYANAVGVWTAATDLAPYSNTKTSLTVTAAGENTVSTDAVTLQLQFGNLMTRAYPELIARHNELALVQHAREAEDNLLSKISAGSTAVTTTNLIGFGRDFLVQVRRAATAYRSRHRIDPQSRLKLIIPNWVYDAMAADLALSMPGDNTLSVSKSEIDGYLAQLNVDITAHFDDSANNGVFGAQGAAALLEFPDTFKWYLFAEGTFLFLDGGTLDLGIIRDSTLVGTNDYKMFVETFENVAKVGIESLAVTSTINVNGVAAALRDTTGGTAAATIEL